MPLSAARTRATSRLPAALFPGDDAEPSVVDAIDAARQTPGFGTDVVATLTWARDATRETGAATASVDAVWQLLASTAALDVAAGRILEPHLDAQRILAEAWDDGIAPDLRPLAADASATWGVFAAEGPGARLTASRTATQTATGWTLTGTKPWCSLAAHLTHALVTAWTDDESRGLFAIALRSPEVHVHDGPWHARGLPHIVSAPIDLDTAPAVAVGDPGWYLSRPGFATGGMGVAATWWGGATGILDALADAASTDRADQLARVHLGRADAALWAARATLADAAARAADGDPIDRVILAARVRAIVADAAEAVLRTADHALGPAPLVTDDAHARRVADLHLYLRQHHAERDLARLGRDLVSHRAQILAASAGESGW
ncbi:acyl-CoA dehydrogenase family protein [Microbacterium chocolatum]|uniref:acyl-CoA dehydrogenase family protein n=1 Tax=Microbacterium aurantiacum TaxID=162393 RepID=UPI00338E4F4A